MTIQGETQQASITAWMQIEGTPYDPTLAGPLQVQVRDALWMLARQWQVGEFTGNDAGSPIQASYALRQHRLDTFIPRQGTPVPLTSAGKPPPPIPPVEILVEQEAATLGLRARFQTGIYFEQAVSQPGTAPSPSRIIADCRAQYPITADVLTVEDADSTLFFGLAGQGAATDGIKLCDDIINFQNGAATGLPASAQALPAALLNDIVAFRNSLYYVPTSNNVPGGNTSWQSDWLQYSFHLTADIASAPLTLLAPDFPGGTLDWYHFSIQPPATNLNAEPPSFYSFFPTHLSFRGAPVNTWWHFEDAQTDLASPSYETTNLPGLLVSAYAVIFGNDWFVTPVTMKVGSLASIDTVVAADTFGARTLIRPTTTLTPSDATWTMFTLTGAQPGTAMLLLPPKLGIIQDGPELEIVDFLRDDMAALAWAVERRIPGPMDTGIDGFESYLTRISTSPAPPPTLDANTEVAYQLGTTVPDNWIPLLPVQDPSNTTYYPIYLQRGVMTREVKTSGTYTTIPILPRGVILAPSPLILADQAVPNEGRNVARYFRRARTIDGTVQTWLCRQARPGRGPGSSGLAFDQLHSQPPA